jgi:hypothetical protein
LYERGSLLAKWTLTVLLFAVIVGGGLVSGFRPLIAISGLLIVAFGLGLARGWGGLAEGLAGGYRRFGMPIPVSMLRLMGWVIIFIGAVWTIAPIASYFS